MFDWEAYLLLARELIVSPAEVLAEAAWRAAASRGYYAAHHTGHHYLEENVGFERGDEGIHRAVILGLQLEMEEVAVDLERLFKNRVHADYEARTFTRGNAEYAVELAASIVDRLR